MYIVSVNELNVFYRIRLVLQYPILNSNSSSVIMPPQRTFGRTQSGPAAFGAISNDASAAGSDDSFNSTKPKRRADFDLGDVTKRPRPDSSRDITTFFSTRHQLTGISTSKTGLVIPTTSSTRPIGQPAAFAVQRHGISGTQDTIKASTQEQHRPLSPSRSKSSEAPLPEIPPIAAPTQRTKASLFVNPTAHNATVADIPLEEPSGLYHHLNCIWRMWNLYQRHTFLFLLTLSSNISLLAS